MELFVTNENELELVIGIARDLKQSPVQGQKQIQVMDVLLSDKLIYNCHILTSLLKELSLYTTTDNCFLIKYYRSNYGKTFTVETSVLESTLTRMEDQLINWYKDHENIHLYQIINNHYKFSELESDVVKIIDNVDISGEIIYKTNTLRLSITIDHL